MKLKNFAIAAVIAAASATTASAAVVAAVLPGEIIAAPAVMTNGNPTSNDNIFAFNEVQDFVLTSDLVVDGGTIAAGSTISSHMIFLNRVKNTGRGRLAGAFDFDSGIIGVISDTAGQLATDLMLGAGVDYSLLTQGGRGLEGNDTYIVMGATIAVDLRARQPGDWMRVITGVVPVAAVPVPAAAFLLPGALLALGGMRRRKTAAKA